MEEAIKNQETIIKHINDSKISTLDGNTISRMIVHLATNNSVLGQMVAEYEYKLDMMTATRKSAWAEKFAEVRSGEEKITQKDTEVIADAEVEDMVKEEIETKHMLLKIKNMRSDCKDVQTALQSRLGHLKQERMDSMLPNPQ